jgi:hypothetical protein
LSIFPFFEFSAGLEQTSRSATLVNLILKWVERKRMSWKSIACIAALGALAAPALAAPTISVVDNGSGTASIFVQKSATSVTSMGVEIALQLAGATLTGATINSAIFDTANPGDSPFIAGSPEGGDATGLVLGLAQNRLFASFGSSVQPAGEYKLLDFTYTGTGTGTATGLVAGRNDANTANVVTSGLDTGAIPLGTPVGNPADFNSDLTVNLLDLSILGTNFGLTPATKAQGDANADTVVNLLDLSILGTEFGWTGSSSVAIPEPTSALLCAAALAGVVARRR